MGNNYNNINHPLYGDYAEKESDNFVVVFVVAIRSPDVSLYA